MREVSTELIGHVTRSSIGLFCDGSYSTLDKLDSSAPNTVNMSFCDLVPVLRLFAD